MSDNRVYQALTDHQQAAQGWNMQTVAAELHRWGELFRLKFKLEIPLPALRLSALRITTLGHYDCGFNRFGLQNEIAISTRHIERCRADGAWWRVLGTLLHEHLHLWQQIHGKPGRNNYHNVQYQKHAAGFGLIVTGEGYTQYAPESPFMDLLREHGIVVPAVPELTVKPPQRGESKLKKWSCGCTNVRVAIADFRAECLKCNRLFTRVE
jgi:hypothetical protein